MTKDRFRTLIAILWVGVATAGGILILVQVGSIIASTPNDDGQAEQTASNQSEPADLPYLQDRGISELADNGGATSPSDPYSKTDNQAVLESYLQARREFVLQVKQLYFAADCGVLYSTDKSAGESNASAAVNVPYQALSALGQSNSATLADGHVGGLIRLAAKDGMNEAARPGACAYWQDHPDEVRTARQEVDDGIRIISAQ